MRATDPTDGLPVSVVRNWAETKYSHVANYASMFAQAMHAKWGRLNYLELYAGGGRVKLKGTDRIVDAASLRALAIRPGFDLYGYSELDPALLHALQRRVATRSAHASCFFKEGDVNLTWPALCARIRESAGNGSHLTFCFVDPYRCADIAFSTLTGLAQLFMDFLVLIPSYMDAHRNQHSYLDESSTALARFLGDQDWRQAWEKSTARFGSFVADHFGVQMRGLGFTYDGLHEMKLIRSSDKNLRLYHLAFFSRHPLGQKLWGETLKYSDPQQRLF